METMQTYIALLRGINVGGINKLPMKELVEILQKLGCSEVTTHIQSGNAVFRSPVQHAQNLAQEIGAAINRLHGFLPQVMLLTKPEMEAAVAANPFPDACTKGNTLHLFFLAETAANPDIRKLAKVQNKNERFTLHDRILYLHAPDGIGRSKLAANIEKALLVPTTARNWNTVCKILELAQQIG